MLTAVILLSAALIVAARLLLSRLRDAATWWAGLMGSRTESELATLFVFVPAARLLLLTVLLAVAAASCAWLLRAPFAVVLLSAALMLAVPRVALARLRTRWRRRLASQLPDMLTLWAGLMRAGQSTPQALSQVAARQRAPLGDELRFLLGQLRLGVPVDQGFAALCRRADIADLGLLATLLATQRELGGNLAESLQRLADLLRSRLQMEGRIDSLTAQGRLQGVVVGVLPLLLLMALYVMEGDAMRVLHTTWQGWTALGVILVLEVVGFVMIRRIVRIEV